MPTKIELTLKQSQQGVSNDVLVAVCSSLRLLKPKVHKSSLEPVAVDRGGGECGGGCEDKSVCAWEDKILSAFMVKKSAWREYLAGVYGGSLWREFLAGVFGVCVNAKKERSGWTSNV
ncbi:hypothetical protein Tco_0934535 [Tanacetum coccineum]